MHCGTHLLSSGAPIPSGLACFPRALISRQPGWSARFENIIVISPGILMFFLYSAGTRIELAVRSIIVKARRLKQRNHIINGGACFGRDLFRFLRLLLPVIKLHSLLNTAPRGRKHYTMRIFTHIYHPFSLVHIYYNIILIKSQIFT